MDRGAMFYLWIFCIVAVTCVIVAVIVASDARAATYLVPADDVIVAPTGTIGLYNRFGHATEGAIRRQAQSIPASSVDRAVCGIDAQVTNESSAYVAGHSVKMAIQNDLNNPTATVYAAYPTIDAHDLPLQFVGLAGAGATSTWIFDPCYTLQAGQQYYMVASVDPTFPLPASVGILMRMKYNSSTPAYMEFKTGGTYAWTTWNSLYGVDEAWRAVIYGFNSISGLPSPVSSDYGFSTGSALGTDLGTTGNFLADIAKYLFVPSDEMKNTITQKRAELATKVPFSYFADVTTLVSGVTTTGAATNTGIIIHTSLGEMPLWDTSTTRNSSLWVGMSGYIFFYIRIFLWGTFAFWVYYRVRDLTV